MQGNDRRIERKISTEQYRFCSGSEYWAIPYEIVVKVLHAYEEDIKLQKILKTVYAPSEFWIHTVLLSSNILSEEEKEKNSDIRKKLSKINRYGTTALF